MESLEELIRSINWQVWYYNEYKNEKRPNTFLSKEPAAAKIIKNACEQIKSNIKNEIIVNNFIDQIEIYCYGEKFIKESRLRQMPEWISGIIIEYCDKIINLCKTDSDDELTKLNNKYNHKWLYFNNYEDTSYIIWIEKISYKGNDFVWTGNKINLHTENSSCGHGINFKSIKEESFDGLGLEFTYDNKKSDIQIIDEFLSKKESKTSGTRELTNEQVKQMIEHELYWGFEFMMEDGIDWPNLYEGKELNWDKF